MKVPATLFIALLALTGGWPGPGASAAGTDEGTAAARILPGLYISNVKVSGINDTSAFIGWDTNYESDSAVEYGLESSYGSSVNDSSLVTSHAIQISNLTGPAEYHFRVLSRQHPADEPACSDDYRFFTTTPPDTTPPRILDLRVGGITETAATVIWDTDEVADARVEYGFDTSYCYSVNAPLFELRHILLLENLSSDSVYHLRARSSDPTGNVALSPDLTFRTLRARPEDKAPPVIAGIRVKDVMDTRAVVVWETDELANSTLDFGLDQNHSKRLDDPNYYYVHSMIIEGLAPSTTYHFRIGSTDVFGNGPSVSADMHFTTLPHTEPPIITILNPANGSAHLNATMVVSGTVRDDFPASGLEFSVNMGPLTAASGAGNWSFIITLRTGNNTITVRARDSYGNIGTAVIVLYLWDSDPGRAIPIATQHDGQTVHAERLAVVSGTVNSSTPIKSFNVTVNGVPVPVEQSGNDWSVRDVKLKEGTNIIEVHAIDEWGNDISRKISVKYAKPEPQPGFEALFILAAVAVGMALLRRLRA